METSTSYKNFFNGMEEVERLGGTCKGPPYDIPYDHAFLDIQLLQSPVNPTTMQDLINGLDRQLQLQPDPPTVRDDNNDIFNGALEHLDISLGDDVDMGLPYDIPFDFEYLDGLPEQHQEIIHIMEEEEEDITKCSPTSPAVQIEEVQHKRLGRPPKQTNGPKKPSKPKETEAPPTVDGDEPEPKRGPGRPKKPKATAPKRGRGRPPKASRH